MLASLLPGLRQLRAPLAAGYLWLVAAWLVFADLIPDGNHAHGVLRKAYDLAGAVGTSTVLAAATFVAYVLGVLSVQITATAVPGLGVFRRRRPSADRPQLVIATPSKSRNTVVRKVVRTLQSAVAAFSTDRNTALQQAIRGLRLGVATPSEGGKATLREAVLDELVQRSAKDSRLKGRLEETRSSFDQSLNLNDPAVRRALLDARIKVDSYASELEKDLPLMPLRLLGEGKQQEIYGEFDRLRAEAEFRASIALPLVVLVGVAGWRVSPWWLIAMVAPVMLVAEARRSVTAAADVMAESIRARAAPSPLLSELEAGELRFRADADWIEFGANKGYPGAMVRMAERCESNGDEKKAEVWYGKAAGAGEPSAMYWLFRAQYQRGDKRGGDEWFEKAKLAKHAVACEIAELAGPDEIDDFKAAYAGHAPAMARVGAHLEKRQRNVEAMKWYRKAVETGYEPARDPLVKLLNAGGYPFAADQIARGARDASAGDDVDLDSALADT
jgi:hypothetical protein